MRSVVARSRALTLLPMLVACSAPAVGLATPADETSASSICSPGNTALEARFGWDGVKNYSDETITLNAIELDERSTDIELVHAGFFLQPDDGTTGGVGPYDGTFDGEPELQLAPGQTALIDVVLRSTRTDDITVAYGLVIHGIRSNGAAVTSHTCWSLAVAPPGVDCSRPEGGEAFDPGTDYLEDVCTLP